ncbi:MAG TPA: phage tail tape measure protein, partial [Polyangiaceae bacterium]|nr:phage tail tape measure protein [Polyangiaceae bacterium]
MSVGATIKQAAKWGFAGAIGGATLLSKRALDVREKFQNLAFTIQAGTGVTQDWQSLMREVQGSAIATGQSTNELADAFGSVFEAVGDADYAKAAMKTIATQATATGDSIETLASIAGTLNEKFGVTAKDLPEALAIAKGLGSKGGVSIQDMADKLSVLGASAKRAGLQGIEGFQAMIAIANSGDDALGGLKKNVAAVTALFDKMTESGQQKEIQKSFGIDVKTMLKKGADPIGVVETILRKTRGNKEKIEAVFQGEEGKLLVDLGKKYAATFDATAGNVETKTQAAVDAFNASLEEAGRSNLNAAQIQTEAARRAQEPQRRLASSLEQLSAKFTDPKIFSAIDRLSDSLPPLTEKMGKLIDLVLENPGTSAAVAAGVKLGAPAIEAAMVAALTGKMRVPDVVAGGAGAGASAAEVAAGAGALGAGGLAVAALPVAAAGAMAYVASEQQDRGAKQGRALAEDEVGTIEGRATRLREAISRAQGAKDASFRVRERGESPYLPQNKAALDNEAL